MLDSRVLFRSDPHIVGNALARGCDVAFFLIIFPLFPVGRRYRLSVTQSVPNSPQLSPISQSEESVYLGGKSTTSIC